MEFGIFNLAMLAGLAGISLPVVAHLLSQRRHVVIPWGAMRFLQLGHRTRRRIFLQDYLLLIVRMAMIACVALAIAQPWGRGGWLSLFGPSSAQDVVFIVDGSGSTGWQGGTATPHQQAIQIVYECLERLPPGSQVSVIDARQVPRRLYHRLVGDFRRVREDMASIPDPAGSGNLIAAMEDALRILSTGKNASQRIVLLTDGQANSWSSHDDLEWDRLQEMRAQFQTEPTIEVFAVGKKSQSLQNFSVGLPVLSRETTVPGFPLKIRAPIRQSGGTVAVEKEVRLEIDGQRMDAEPVRVTVPPNGETIVEFEQKFATPGEFVLSIVLDPDHLPADNRADAAVSISPGLPALILDGDARLDPTQSESFYVQSAFNAAGEKSAWVKTSILPAEKFTQQQLAGMKVVFLLNVRSLTPRQWKALSAFVNEGGGLVIAPGDRTDPANWNRLDQEGETFLLPATFGEQQQAGRNETTEFDSQSFQAPWLHRFRRENGVDLIQTRLNKWWKLSLPSATSPKDQKPSADPDLTMVDTSNGHFPVEVLAVNTQGDPLIVTRKFGQGQVLQLAFPLDADWSTLPAKGDFVPFLYELTFQLAGQQSRRNVETNMPLLLPLPAGMQENYMVSGPGIVRQPAVSLQKGHLPFAVFRDTALPGVYRFERTGSQHRGVTSPFVVHDDRKESDLTQISDDEWAILQKERALVRVMNSGDLMTLQTSERPRVEFWWLLLLAVMGLLIWEAALTRRMVQGGHQAAEVPTTPVAATAESA